MNDHDKEMMIESVSANVGRDILSACISNLLKGHNGPFTDNEEGKIEECLDRFSQSLVLVTDAWLGSMPSNDQTERGGASNPTEQNL